jgi:hypothetical protein
MARLKEEVLTRDGAGRKQCGRCWVWLPETVFTKSGKASDGLHSWCNRCVADRLHHLSVERRQQMLAEQNGKCMCGYVFDVYGSRNVGYEIDHDHGCCPGKWSCGKETCIRALVCPGCNKRDRNNPYRTTYGSSKYRGVSWAKREQKWRITIQRGGKQFCPSVMGDLPYFYENEDDAGAVSRQLEDYLNANPHLWQPQLGLQNV